LKRQNRIEMFQKFLSQNEIWMTKIGFWMIKSNVRWLLECQLWRHQWFEVPTLCWSFHGPNMRAGTHPEWPSSNTLILISILVLLKCQTITIPSEFTSISLKAMVAKSLSVEFSGLSLLPNRWNKSLTIL